VTDPKNRTNSYKAYSEASIGLKKWPKGVVPYDDQGFS